MSSNMKSIDEGGGYDLDEIKAAREVFQDNKDVDTSGMVDVEPIFIQVTNEVPVEEKEYEARAVIIEYDAYGEVVSVELL